MSHHDHDHHHHEHNDGCCCGHHHGYDCFHEHIHEEDVGFIKEHGFNLLKIGVSTILLLLGVLLPVIIIVKIILYAVAYLISSYEIIIKCVKKLLKGEIFDENFLMVLSSIVAFILGEYFEGVLIVLLFSVGELLEHVAIGSSRKRIKNLSELKISVAHLYKDGEIIEVSPEKVEVGSIIQVNKGGVLPIDGEILSDYSEFDLKAVTGESKPFALNKGDKVYSGSINLSEPVLIKTTVLYKDSTAEKIIAMVENSVEKKAKTQKLISKFAKVYTPTVVILALIIAFIPQFFVGDFAGWVYKALSFLVVSCPCALVISVPLSYFIGIGSFAKKGVLIKGGTFVDGLAQVNTVLFDKTGTITKGSFSVSKIDVISYDEDLISAICNLEKNSNHPISKALIEYAKINGVSLDKTVKNVKEIPGKGLTGEYNDKQILVGNKNLLKDIVGEINEEEFNGSIVYVSLKGALSAKIYLEDTIKENADTALKLLDKVGVKRKIILSGDNINSVKSVAKALNVKEYYAELFPQDKVKKTEEIINSTNDAVMFVGDGINDAPVLALSNVGVAMGALGSESAIESADVVVMDDDLRKIPLSIKHAKKIKRIIMQNIVFSLGAKFLIMCLSVIISLPLYVAVVGDVGIMLISILNSLRNYKIAPLK